MTIAATVNAEVDAILDAAMKPPTRQDGRRINHAHCVYCTVVVGESMWHGDEVLGLIEEWEGYGVMPEGPVCLECLSDYGRVRAAWEWDMQRHPRRMTEFRLRRRGRMRIRSIQTPQEQAAEIKELYVGQGMTQTAIAAEMRIARSTVRRRMIDFGIESQPRPRGPMQIPSTVDTE